MLSACTLSRNMVRVMFPVTYGMKVGLKQVALLSQRGRAMLRVCQ